MEQQHTFRFSAAPWAKSSQDKLSAAIVGVGSIGSWTALFLARTGIFDRIMLVDFDYVSPLNLAGQLYSIRDVGSLKVNAIGRAIALYAPSNIVVESRANWIERDYHVGDYDIVIAATDSITSRQTLYDTWRNMTHTEEIGMLIDARLTAESFEIYFVSGPNSVPADVYDRIIEFYKGSLFAEGEGMDLPCSFKSTTHFAANIAAKIVHGITAFIAYKHGSDYVVPVYYSEQGMMFTRKLLTLEDFTHDNSTQDNQSAL